MKITAGFKPLYFSPFEKAQYAKKKTKKNGVANFTVEKSDRHCLSQVVKIHINSNVSALSGPNFQDDQEKKKQESCLKGL